VPPSVVVKKVALVPSVALAMATQWPPELQSMAEIPLSLVVVYWTCHEAPPSVVAIMAAPSAKSAPAQQSLVEAQETVETTVNLGAGAADAATGAPAARVTIATVAAMPLQTVLISTRHPLCSIAPRHHYGPTVGQSLGGHSGSNHGRMLWEDAVGKELRPS
jgi:hypothetical protein